jgi:septum formation protein
MSSSLVLGSASPRRADLLRQLRLDFVQIVSPEEEPPIQGGAPQEHVTASAAAKAGAVRRFVEVGHVDLVQAIVIGADTVVELEGQMLGKPADAAAAAQMLGHLSGRRHRVFTGVALSLADGTVLEDSVETQVQFGILSAADIAAYVASGEPLDKAGAYGIQGGGARFIERIDGCYYNVVGLPIFRLCQLLHQAGFEFNSAFRPA